MSTRVSFVCEGIGVCSWVDTLMSSNGTCLKPGLGRLFCVCSLCLGSVACRFDKNPDRHASIRFARSVLISSKRDWDIVASLWYRPE